MFVLNSIGEQRSLFLTNHDKQSFQTELRIYKQIFPLHFYLIWRINENHNKVFVNFYYICIVCILIWKSYMKKILIILIISIIPSIVLSKNLEWKKIDISFQGKIYGLDSIDSTHQLFFTIQGFFIYKDFKILKNIGDSIVKYGNISGIIINKKKEIIISTRNNGILKYDNEKWVNITYNLPIKSSYVMSVNDNDDLMVLYSENYNSKSYTAILKNNTYSYDINQNNFKFYDGNIFNYNNKQVIFNDYDNALYISDLNKGKIEWSFLDSSSYLKKISSIKMYRNKLYAFLNDGNFVSYNIDTKVWENIGNNIGKFNTLNFLITDKGELILYSNNPEGIYYSSDEGITFEQNDDGLKNIHISFLTLLNDGKILCMNYLNEFYLSDAPKDIEYDTNFWADRIQYKELNTNNRAVDLLKISKDANKFYSVIDSFIQTYDLLSGKLINSKLINTENSRLMNIFLNDGTFSVLRISYNHSNYIAEYKIEVFDIDKNNLIRNYSFIDSLPKCGQYFKNYSLAYSSIDFNPEEDKLLLNLAYHVECDGSAESSNLYGKLFEIDFSVEPSSFKLIYDNPLKNYFFIDENRAALLRTSSSYFSTSTIDRTTTTNDIMITNLNTQDTTYLLSDVNKDFENKFYRDVKGLFNFSNHNQIIAWATNNYIYRWNLTDYSIIDSILLDKKYEAIAISNDLKYLVAANMTGYYIFKFPNLELVHFEHVNNYGFKNLIEYLPDLSGFLVATGTNIRYFEFSKITDVFNEEIHPISSIILYPNPATDYITINLERCATLQKCGTSTVEIYDVIGILIHSTPVEPQNFVSLQQRIDISNLSPGVYFLKIGDRVEKFVKY